MLRGVIHCTSPYGPVLSPTQHFRLPMRAAAGAIYRPRSRARGKISGLLSRVAGAECPRYFNDQATGRAIGRAIGLSVHELALAPTVK